MPAFFPFLVLFTIAIAQKPEEFSVEQLWCLNRCGMAGIFQKISFDPGIPSCILIPKCNGATSSCLACITNTSWLPRPLRRSSIVFSLLAQDSLIERIDQPSSTARRCAKKASITSLVTKLFLS